MTEYQKSRNKDKQWKRASLDYREAHEMVRICIKEARNTLDKASWIVTAKKYQHLALFINKLKV